MVVERGSAVTGVEVFSQSLGGNKLRKAPGAKASACPRVFLAVLDLFNFVRLVFSPELRFPRFLQSTD